METKNGKTVRPEERRVSLLDALPKKIHRWLFFIFIILFVLVFLNMG